MAYIEFPPPLKGLSSGLSVSYQEEGASGYMSNIRPRDTLEGRLRIGQRPGMKKAYTQQIGGDAQPVVYLGSVTTVDPLITAGHVNYKTGDDGSYTPFGANWQAQVITTEGAYYCPSVQLKMYRVGSPGTITASLRLATAVGSGAPTGADLPNLVGTYDGDTLTVDTDGEWITFEFTGAKLSANTRYAIVVRCPTGDGGANTVHWRTDGSTPTYAGGGYATSNDSGETWGVTGTSRDFMFDVESGVTDKTYTKQLVAIGNNEVWYESSAGTMTEVADANGDLITTVPLDGVEAYERQFIFNGSNLKILDLQNTKISTDDAGANPPKR